MLFCFAACGSEPAVPEEPNRLGTIAKDKLIMAVSPDFIPMEFVDTAKEGDEAFAGFDMDLARYLAEGLELELVIKPMSLEACQEAVASGESDIAISGFAWTENRARNYLLSDPYYAGDQETGQSVICLKENGGAWSQASDLAGAAVGVVTGSLQEDLAKAQLPQDAVIQGFESIEAALAELRAGKLSGVCVPHGTGAALVQSSGDLAFSGFDFDVSGQLDGNVILLGRKAEELQAAINGLLAKAYEEDLYSGWYAKAKELAASGTAAEQSYDEKGKIIKSK